MPPLPAARDSRNPAAILRVSTAPGHLVRSPTGEESAMPWTAVLTLPDGSRVESSVLADPTASAAHDGREYRLRLVDGSICEFSTLIAILRHLVDHYSPEDLTRVTWANETPMRS